MALVGTEPQRAADILHAVLVRHQGDDGMRGVRIQLNAVRIVVADHVADKLHNGKLHAKTESEERDIIFARVADGINHALDAPVAKTAGDKDAVRILERLRHIFRIDKLGVNPLDIHRGMLRDSAVL